VETIVHRIGFVIFPNFQVMGFAAITAFEVANLVLGEEAYAVTLLSETGGLVKSSAGFRVETELFGTTKFDTVMIGAGIAIEPVTSRLIEFIKRSMKTSRRVAAPCIGAFALAEAGALDGRRATTHWAFARELQARFPGLHVEEDRIYVIDGPVWTSAGMTAGIDLAPGRSRASSWSITEDQAGSRNSPRCSSSNRSLTGSSAPSTMPTAICGASYR
jgi:transcriptional regulator GlxA family with amidase domain